MVSVGRLILHVLSPLRPVRVSCCANPVNVLGKDSQVLLQSFGAATRQCDLHLLTLSAFQGTISQPRIFRTTEAWCPVCLDQWRTAEMPVYSPLLWSIRVVTVCPAHSSPLIECCPRCHRQFAPLRAKAQSGCCSICLQWLGSSDSVFPQGPLDEQQYNLWVATSVGQVLAAMPDLQQHLLPATLKLNLYRCLSQTEGATKEYLSALADSGPWAFTGWVSGRIKPSLDQLCRLSYQLKLPLILLFRGVPADWRGPENLREEIHRQKKDRPALSLNARTELRRVLIAALSQSPPPSVAAIARGLKFRCTQTLRSREPDLCKQLAVRRRDSGIIVENTKRLYKKSEKRRLEDALRRHLAKESPVSLNDIASNLGYKGSGSIRERCPELCQAIVKKRKRHFQQKREEMRCVLENARTEDPPPSLKHIARRLGFTAEGILVHTFPEMCAVHKQRRTTWLQEHREQRRLSIRQWLATEPAPTTASVCLRFGISLSYFPLHFPEEYAEVLKRISERNRIAHEHRCVAMRKEVFTTVQHLREKNIYPSLARVKSALSPGLTRSWLLLRSAIDDAISQFGAAMRPRNELGRFV